MLGRVEGVGREDEVEGVVGRRPFVAVSATVVVLVGEGGGGGEIRPIERGGRDGAAAGGQVCVAGDVVG